MPNVWTNVRQFQRKPGAALPKAVSNSIPYGQQPKLSLKEAFREKPSKAAQGIWDQQSMESGPLKGMWPGNQTEPRPVTRGEQSHPQCHQGGRTNLAKAKHSLGQPCLIHRISKAHPSKKRADKSDCERAVSDSNPHAEMGILESRTQLSAINPRIEGSIIHSS
ncbi:hypothetical protein DPX16_16574 [Anabarilius grahami]|uniref:Uncharacterized protein n=1 Tax=Anabarilius grahami TaxID=495550 RepID=A0A3N0XV27_ANAGA|nr:hypothetical protein DPX16_16574 [Anabarilius grahami]